MKISNLPRDLSVIHRYVKSLLTLRQLERSGGCVGKLFDQVAQKNPNRVCLYFEDEEWTYQKVYERSNQIANFFKNEGLQRNDQVALFMGNRPEYICTWLGLTKIGVIPALINFNLRSHPLKHCFEISKPKAAIYGNELSEAMNELYGGDKSPSFPIYSSGDKQLGCYSNREDLDLDAAITTFTTETPKELQNITFLDPLFFIFTSGTTGLPKAAVIRHSRFLMSAVGMKNIHGFREHEDILFTPFPLYHTAGGILTLSQAICSAVSVVIAQKFSATDFWKTCIKYNVTGAQYMGETCRYLLRQAPSPAEKEHSVRIMFGNGLRPEIWDEFVTRFNIKEIVEIYGSTEGNANFTNSQNKSGAVGYIPPLLKPFFPFEVIQLDKNTEEPVRDSKTGLAVRCKPGERGELVSRIAMGHPFRDFKGYADNQEATNKKILRNVIKKGDEFFRTGDLFEMDEEGFYYFKDRMGDTFRWKSENVSTSEVEYILSGLAGFRDVIVFGVPIPGMDGRAGMAVVADPNGGLDLESLAAGIAKELPTYARPVFLRVTKEIESTGTHKMKKVAFQEAGYYETGKYSDPIYFYNKNEFIPLTDTLYTELNRGDIKL